MTIINLSSFPLNRQRVIHFSLLVAFLLSYDILRYYHPYMLPMPLLVYSHVSRLLLVLLHISLFINLFLCPCTVWLIIFSVLRISSCFLGPLLSSAVIFLIGDASFVFYSSLYYIKVYFSMSLSRVNFVLI